MVDGLLACGGAQTSTDVGASGDLFRDCRGTREGDVVTLECGNARALNFLAVTVPVARDANVHDAAVRAVLEDLPKQAGLTVSNVRELPSENGRRVSFDLVAQGTPGKAIMSTQAFSDTDLRLALCMELSGAPLDQCEQLVASLLRDGVPSHVVIAELEPQAPTFMGREVAVPVGCAADDVGIQCEGARSSLSWEVGAGGAASEQQVLSVLSQRIGADPERGERACHAGEQSLVCRTFAWRNQESNEQLVVVAATVPVEDTTATIFCTFMHGEGAFATPTLCSQLLTLD